MFDRITFDPKIVGGRACIRGMRIPVSVIVSHIAMVRALTKSYTNFRHLNARMCDKPSVMQQH